MRARIRAVSWLTGILATLVLSACGATSSNTSSPSQEPASEQAAKAPTVVKGGTLRLAAVDPGAAIDPVTVASGAGVGIAGAVAENLTFINDKGQPEGVLATEWEPSEDGKTWTFTLRSGVQFQDGRPLTAADVVASYERIIGPDSVSPGKSAFVGILKSVSASGDDTVEFRLERPFSDFPVLTAATNTYILPEDYELGTWEKHPVGTGPFKLETYNKGQSAEFVANPTYWGKDDIYLAALKINFYKDAQARVLALQSGEVDSLLGEPLEASLTAALSEDEYSVQSIPNAGFTAFALRTDEAPFDDVKVRQAVAWALDREGIVQTVLGGDGSIGNDTIYAPVYPLKPQGLEQRAQDLDRVKTLLGGKTVKFTITSSPADETLATVIQQQRHEVEGFDVDIKVLPSAEYYADGNDAPWLNATATLTYWASRPSPSQYNGFLYSKASDWNASKYSNPKLEQISAEYDAATDDATKQTLIDQIAKIQWDEVPVIVTTYGKSRTFSSKQVHDIPQVPGATRYQGLWVG